MLSCISNHPRIYRLGIILFTIFCCHLSTLYGQHSSLRLYTRFSGLGQYTAFVPERDIKADGAFNFYGLSFALRSHKDRIRFQQYEIGGFFSKNRYPGQDQDLELFLRYQTRLFRPMMDRPSLLLYFSLGPRLFYGKELDNGAGNLTGYPATHRYYGAEIPIIFNADINITEKLSLLVSTNALNMAYYSDITIVDNPALTERQREIGGFASVVNFLNEWRLGIGYDLQ